MKEKLLYFIRTFIIVFLGFSLTNIISVIIHNFSDGDILLAISQLPYWLYGVFSLLLSALYYCKFLL